MTIQRVVGLFATASGIVITLGVYLNGQQNSTQLFACANPAGQLRLVAGPGSCHAQEQPVSWNTVGATGPQGPAGPAGSSSDRVVVDFNGVEVGTTFGSSEILLTLVDGTFLRAAADRRGFGQILTNLQFTTTDCTGQAYTIADFQFIRRAAGVDQSNELWYGDSGAAGPDRTAIRSQLVVSFAPNPPPPTCQPLNGSVFSSLIPARHVNVGQFAAPFRLQ